MKKFFGLVIGVILVFSFVGGLAAKETPEMEVSVSIYSE